MFQASKRFFKPASDHLRYCEDLGDMAPSAVEQCSMPLLRMYSVHLISPRLRWLYYCCQVFNCIVFLSTYLSNAPFVGPSADCPCSQCFEHLFCNECPPRSYNHSPMASIRQGPGRRAPLLSRQGRATVCACVECRRRKLKVRHLASKIAIIWRR